MPYVDAPGGGAAGQMIGVHAVGEQRSQRAGRPSPRLAVDDQLSVRPGAGAKLRQRGAACSRKRGPFVLVPEIDELEGSPALPALVQPTAREAGS